MRIFSYNPQDKATTPPTTVRVQRAEPTPEGGIQTDQVTLIGPLEPKDGGYEFDPRNARRWTAACAFASVANTVDTFQGYLQAPLKWSFEGPQLGVVANAGGALNAFYSRDAGKVLFFVDHDGVTGESVQTGGSGEVTAHEAGHAMLDALRPGYLRSFTPDVGAFHEAFGDLMALYTTLLNPEVAARVPDLRQDNLASAFGEQLGMAINHNQHKDVTGGDWARNANNHFVWQDPASLPSEAPPDQLTSEVHNLSRLWSGASYEVLAGMVDARRAAGESQVDALQHAADESLKMYADLLQTTAPESDFTFAGMAQAWIASQEQNAGGRHADLIRDVMTLRGILGASVEQAPRCQETTVLLEGPEFGRFAGTSVSAPVTSRSPGEALRGNVARLIQADRVKWTEPHQVVKQSDLVDPQGNPYVGVVRWLEGKPVIERVGLLA